jgi:sulfonate transport system substrate-binding protein
VPHLANEYHTIEIPMKKTSFPVTSLTRRRLLLGAGALLAASGLSSISSLAADMGENGAVSTRAARRRVRIGYLRSADPLTLAHSHGSLEKSLGALGVDVQWYGPFDAYAPVAEALNAGRIDITMGSSTAAISSLAGHAPLVLFGYQRYAPEASGIVVPQASPIRSVRDLIGKTVAVNRAGSGEYALVLALQHAGIPQNAVAKAYLNPPDSAAAFSEGKVDAWSAWGPLYPTALTSLHGRILITGREIDSKNAVVFVAHVR